MTIQSVCECEEDITQKSAIGIITTIPEEFCAVINDPRIYDPCSCTDPLNILDNARGEIKYFHDFALIEDGPGETWRLTSVNAGNVLDQLGNPIGFNTNDAILVYDPVTGTYRLDLYHIPAVGFNATFTRDRDGSQLTTGGSCDNPCDLVFVPTMNEWGLLIFGLLVLNLSLYLLGWREKVTVTI